MKGRIPLFFGVVLVACACAIRSPKADPQSLLLTKATEKASEILLKSISVAESNVDQVLPELRHLHPPAVAKSATPKPATPKPATSALHPPHDLQCFDAACNEIGVNGGNALLLKGKSLRNTGTSMLGSSSVCENTHDRRRPSPVLARPVEAGSSSPTLPAYADGAKPTVCVGVGFKKNMCETSAGGVSKCRIMAVVESSQGVTKVVCERLRTSTCAGQNVCPKPIRRNDILSRSNVWLGYPIAYSQGRYHTETQSPLFHSEPNAYRSDCSGFVAMSWKLEMCAVTTFDMLNQTPRGKSALRIGYHRIKCNALKMGDALVTDTRSGLTGHVILFDKWADEAAKEKEFWAIDQTFSEYRGTVRRRWSMAKISDLFKTTTDRNLNVKCGRRKKCDGSGHKRCEITATHAIQSKDTSSYGKKLAPFFCIRRNNLLDATGETLEATPQRELWDKKEANSISDTRCFSKKAEKEEEARKLAARMAEEAAEEDDEETAAEEKDDETDDS